MTYRSAALLLVISAVTPEPSSADSSLVRVSVELELDSTQCLPGFRTVVGTHRGTITAIGLEDRNKTWSLYGGTGTCAPFGIDKPFTESTVHGILESSPVLETQTRFDQRCATLPDKRYFAETLASGPWDTLHPSNHPFERLDCKRFSC